ncbi:hypothetical protein FD720_04950 [Photobacterium damselae subsp. damselae]|nr:hypothetical protein FD721_09690 [Photobacterium damselae subsp. damselae]TLS88519.1 hypothetical protein FD720_04950 [Photobacterium damselae subsp. damselae]
MAKKVKPTTREHISLALELYNRIPQGRKVTAQILQEELRQSGIERDIRTIQRTEGSPHNFPKAQPCLNRF